MARITRRPPILKMPGQLILLLLLQLTASQATSSSSWNLFNPNLDHYTKAISLVHTKPDKNGQHLLRGIEVGRAAARHNPNHRDSWVNLAGFILNLFNKKDYAEPVSHVQALELFSIMAYAFDKWPAFHGTIHNMESTLRWLSSSSPEEANIHYDTTLDGENGWQKHPKYSTGDRLLAYEYGKKNALPIDVVVAHRGPLFIPLPYFDFVRDTKSETKRIEKLQGKARLRLEKIQTRRKRKKEEKKRRFQIVKKIIESSGEL